MTNLRALCPGWFQADQGAKVRKLRMTPHEQRSAQPVPLQPIASPPNLPVPMARPQRRHGGPGKLATGPAGVPVRGVVCGGAAELVCDPAAAAAAAAAAMLRAAKAHRREGKIRNGAVLR